MERSDEEQLEQLKEWWRRNGPGLMLGAALAITLFAVWWGYNTWQERSAQAAAVAYAEYLDAERRGADLNRLEVLADRLRSEHSASGYAALAAMRLARQQVSAGTQAEAVETLGWLVDHAAQRPTAELARLRQARALADDDPEGAVGLLQREVSAGFRAAYAELRGDLLVDLGRKEEAAAAYREVLAVNGLAPHTRELVEIKLRAAESPA